MAKLSKDEMVRFILVRKYFLKLYRVAQSKWRKKIAEELIIKYGLGNADIFIESWNYLKAEGLL